MDAPPDASRIIFSIERGPRVVRMMSETAWGCARGAGTRVSAWGTGSIVVSSTAVCPDRARKCVRFDLEIWTRRGIAGVATHLRGGDVVQLRGAAGLALGAGVCGATGDEIASVWWPPETRKPAVVDRCRKTRHARTRGGEGGGKGETHS